MNTSLNPPRYDIIGDIHGYATPLRHLLAKLDYQEIHGVWQHPERKAVFLGDFVDRGPEQVETVNLVRAMVEQGHAFSVMGNHEFNAIAWATPHPDKPGEFLRAHTDKNLKQHRAFLEQVGEGSERHQAMLEWFKSLPLYLELDGVRVIHACWHEPSLQTLAPLLDDKACLRAQAWPAVTEKGSAAYDALETLLKGLEIPLPDGHEFLDKDKHPRRHIRTQWWNTEYLTYRDIAEVPPEILVQIPHDPAPADLMPGYAGDKLLFVGHYWRTGTPTPLSDHVACLDYSIAAEAIAQSTSPDQTGIESTLTRPATPIEPGKLCAYRFNGERKLDPHTFVWVSE